jgi:starch-binding outer membrane protein, SusD/RagB family
MKSIYQYILFTTILSFIATSCKKQLEKRPNSNVLVPKTPTQMHGLLDNPEVFGYGHTLGLLSADEFYFTPAYYKQLTETMKNLYTWQNYPFNATETDYDYKKDLPAGFIR